MSVRNCVVVLLIAVLAMYGALPASAQGTPVPAISVVPRRRNARSGCRSCRCSRPASASAPRRRRDRSCRPRRNPLHHRPVKPPMPRRAAAIAATVREAIACRNAGDFLRVYTLFTQDMLVALFGGPATVDPEVRSAVAKNRGRSPARGGSPSSPSATSSCCPMAAPARWLRQKTRGGHFAITSSSRSTLPAAAGGSTPPFPCRPRRRRGGRMPERTGDKAAPTSWRICALFNMKPE